MRKKKHLDDECRLVLTYQNKKVTEIFENKETIYDDITKIVVPATERKLSIDLLISTRQARQACSTLVELGYLKKEKVAGKTLYGLTGAFLEDDILQDIDLENIDDDIEELFFYFNLELENNDVPEDLRLYVTNPFHIYYLTQFLHKVDNKIDKAKELIDQSSKEINKYDFKKHSARALVNEIRKTMEIRSRRKKRIIPDRLYKNPDTFLKREYHLRKSNRNSIL